MLIQPIQMPRNTPPVALILGTGDIASAIGRALFLAGCGVAMLRDTATPVLRRAMAFDDALEDGVAELDGVWGVRATTAEWLAQMVLAREAVVLAHLDLAVVATACRGLDSVLIDARMRKYAASADLRPLANCAIGIGPGFTAGGNVGIAIETLPGHEGRTILTGPTASPTGRAEALGGARDERFVTAATAGIWLPYKAIGDWVAQDALIGMLGCHQLRAPIAGRVRGLVRPMPGGVARGSKLAELDPRLDAPCRGVPARASRIAAGVSVALGLDLMAMRA
jgi:xanthine dehydrogenase accessory factor